MLLGHCGETTLQFPHHGSISGGQGRGSQRDSWGRSGCLWGVRLVGVGRGENGGAAGQVPRERRDPFRFPHCEAVSPGTFFPEQSWPWRREAEWPWRRDTGHTWAHPLRSHGLTEAPLHQQPEQAPCVGQDAAGLRCAEAPSLQQNSAPSEVPSEAPYVSARGLLCSFGRFVSPSQNSHVETESQYDGIWR